MARTSELGERRGEVARLLADHLPFSPLDFVPGIALAGDREIYAEKLTGDLPPDDDRRLLVRSQGQEVAILGRRLAWDSQFFGYDVVRLDGIFPTAPPLDRPRADYRKPLKSWLQTVRKRGARYVFAQVDPRDLATLRALGENRFSLIETRYLHHGPVLEPKLGQRYPVRQATLDDIPSLARAASQAVNAYDRFHADPAIDADRAAELMEQWIAESVAGRMADVVIVPDVPEPEAFVTYRYHRADWPRWGLPVVQGVLSAVAPQFRGWMGKLGPEVAYHLYGQGARYSWGTTQVTNRSIVWLAQDGGARFGRCEHVLRRVF